MQGPEPRDLDYRDPVLKPWLSKLERVREAASAEERHAIYSFRYHVYVEELGRELGGVDHSRRILTDEGDEEAGAVHFYTGSLEDITGVARLRVWAPGQIPRHDFDLMSLGRFPGIEGQSVSELGRIMVRPNLRGRLLLPSLVRAVYERGVQAGVDLGFCYCAPGLVQHYRKLGFRPYAAPLVPTVDGLHVALVGIASDEAYLRAVGSPVASLVSRYYGSGAGRRAPVDVAALAGLLDPDASAIELSPDEVWREVQADLLWAGTPTSSILDGLSAAAIRTLTTKGFTLSVVGGTLVTRAGYAEREMYIVLAGALEVVGPDGGRLNVLGPGDLFGELAFFRGEGRRTASVRAATDCQLLVLRRHFLAELGRSDPDVAMQLLINLGGILAERLVHAEQRATRL